MQEPDLNVMQIMIDEIKELKTRIDVLESNEYPTARIKSDTGDYTTGYSFQFVNNTFDNNLKVWLEGAWRTVIAAY